ncbi:hypothetical protein LTR78_008595 [Recurvomyces mirabilis]|uniref:Uncharacterized protein n=1 Tax=Recurvomyces mirabilis TaxID=574656 RepID=A0AAE0TPS8_9PEZI|nr:hypothetical protein LTR78_008595 [Recurvomyces mirabilis]KAK5153493.1 hypothetical protein LTS14_007664 [Recurvomyces mirabilis]
MTPMSLGFDNLCVSAVEDMAMSQQFHRRRPRAQVQAGQHPLDPRLYKARYPGQLSRSDDGPFLYSHSHSGNEVSQRGQVDVSDMREHPRTVKQDPAALRQGYRYDDLVARDRTCSPRLYESDRDPGNSRAGTRPHDASTTEWRPSAYQSRLLEHTTPLVQHSSSDEIRKARHKAAKSWLQEESILHATNGWPITEDMDEPVTSAEVWTKHAALASSTAKVAVSHDIPAHTLQWLNSQASGPPTMSALEEEEGSLELDTTMSGSWSPTAEAFLDEGIHALTTQTRPPIGIVAALTASSCTSADVADSPTSATRLPPLEDDSSRKPIKKASLDELSESISNVPLTRGGEGPHGSEVRTTAAPTRECEHCQNYRCGIVLPSSSDARLQGNASKFDVPTLLRLAAASDAVEAKEPTAHAVVQEQIVADRGKEDGKASGWVMVSEVDPLNNKDDFDFTEIPGPDEAALLSGQETISWWSLARWFGRRM